MGIEEDLLDVMVYQDDARVGIIKMHREYVSKLAMDNGLTSFFEDSLCYYTCVDGPVLLIWGVQDHKTKIIGLTLNPDELKLEAALRKAWEEHKSKTLRMKDVHNAIIRSTHQMLN
jgi:iron only hydrogenase large subunit-like protein